MFEKIKNPFRYLPLRQAICWGIAALILTSVFCWQVGLRLTSLTQVNFAGGALWKATVQQIVVWLAFSVVLYITGVMMSRSKVRFWDVASFNLFARIPFDLSLLIFAIPMVRSITGLLMDGNMARVMEYTTILSVIGIAALFFVVWYFYWTYNAFSEATNLKNGRGVAIFVVSYVVTYVATGYIFTLI